jgi:small conductance mechanosensitive channel
MRRKIKQHVPAIAAGTRARSLTIQTAQKAKQAKLELIVLVPLMAITVTAYVRREELFGADTPVRLGAAVAMVALGWLVARDIGPSRRPRCSGAWIRPPPARSRS